MPGIELLFFIALSRGGVLGSNPSFVHSGLNAATDHLPDIVEPYLSF